MRRIVPITIPLLLLGSCTRKSNPLPPSRPELPPPLVGVLGSSIARITEEKVLIIGQSCSPSQPSPIRVRLDRIDVEKQACLLQVEDTETGHKSSGWVQAGQCASFAPDEVGTAGLKVTEVTPEKVTIHFNSCRYAQWTDTKPADE